MNKQEGGRKGKGGGNGLPAPFWGLSAPFPNQIKSNQIKSKLMAHFTVVFSGGRKKGKRVVRERGGCVVQ